ncbi:MAG: MarR family winged helix-turn-helix transcriptional regulator [Alicyclobacillus sp.]|nr:MarR family winged helix-turn-helix transcriptional regulator [Alicyclobacillus sp.]
MENDTTRTRERIRESRSIAQLAEQLDDMLPSFLRLVMDRLLSEPTVVSTDKPDPMSGSTSTPSAQGDSDATADPHAITLPQAYLLRQIAVRGACTAAEVGRILGVTSGPVTSMTQRLMQRGWLERRRDEQDRRVMRFSLSPAGERMVQYIHERRQERWTMLLGRLGPDKAVQLLNLLQDVVDILYEWPREEPPASGTP